MKTIKFFAAVMMAAVIASCAPKGNEQAVAEGETPATEQAEATQSEETSVPSLPTKAEAKDASYLLGVNFGSMIKGYGFEGLSYSEIVKGMKDFVNAEGSPSDSTFAEQFKVDPNKMGEILNGYLAKLSEYKAAQNKEKGEKFLADNAKKEGVQVTESGLQYIIIEQGSDVVPTATDVVSVSYKGTLIDGTVFDESTSPIELNLGSVIKGWTEGLQLIGEGGKITLFVPAELGYGERGNQRIEPNSTLIFDVTLDKVVKAEEEKVAE